MTVDADKYYRETAYTYDMRNNMTKAEVTTPDYVNNQVTTSKVTQTNAYNASGQRIQKVEGGETTNYYYMGSALLFSSNANNWLLTENILDPNGIIVASARFDDANPGEREGFYFYHYDMRGSTTAIVGADGKLQKGYSYDTFGAIEESGNKSFLNEVTFTGSVTDKSTGLQYMNSRFYDSSTGRFLTQDSYSGNPYDPWTQHLYSYCGNNPVNMVDPTGHFCISAIIIGAIVGAVIGAGIVGYQDYKDDGKIFNGSKTVGNYLMGAAVGGVVGAAAGTAVAAAAGGTAATAGLSALGKAAVSAGSAGAIGAGTNAAIQAASKGITNVDGKEAALAGVKSAAVSFVCSGLGSLAKGSGAGQSLYDSKGSPSPGKAVDSYQQSKTSLYRSVSEAEAMDIQTTGKFNLAQNGLEAKQFGFDIGETASFGERVGQTRIAECSIPTNMLNVFNHTKVDGTIFRHGTLTVYDDLMDTFNNAISNIKIH